MNTSDLLAREDVLVDLRLSSKTRVLADLAGHAGRRLRVAPDLVLNALLGREELGSTGLGAGIAIPHARLPAVTTPFGVLARLRSPIEFDAVDGAPVDLVFLLLLPSGEAGRHLNALACVARRLRDPAVAGLLRTARQADAVWDAIVDPPHRG